MKISRENFLTNRALFNQNPIALLYIKKNKTNSNFNSNSNIDTDIRKDDEKKSILQEESFLKLVSAKSFYRKTLKEDYLQPNPDSGRINTDSQNILQKTRQTSQDEEQHNPIPLNKDQTEVFNLSFLLKKLINFLSLRVSVRTTQAHLIGISTLYFVAILSTIQRQTGNRWLSVLCDTKLPGYSTRYQDMSWETFKNSRQKQISSYSNTKPSQAPLTGIDSYISFVDLHKGKACIYLRSPWEKEIRKDFVGFFMKKEQQKNFDNHNQNTVLLENQSNKNYISLPWYRIEAFNRPNRVIIATSANQQNSFVSKSLRVSDLDFEDLSQAQVSQRGAVKLPSDKDYSSAVSYESTSERSEMSNDVRRRRERSVIGLSSQNSQDKFGTSTSVSRYPIQEKISGFEFVFPFQRSKERIYVQNDSIPLKLESAYGQLDSISSSTNQIGLSAAIDGIANHQKEDTLTKRNKLFWGKEIYSLEEAVRTLFYSYGFFPPSDLSKLSDDKSTKSQKGIESLMSNGIKEKNKELFEEGFQHKTSLQEGKKEHTELQDAFKKVGKEAEEQGAVTQNSKQGEALYKELLMFVSKELEGTGFDKVENNQTALKSHLNGKDKQESTQVFELDSLLAKKDLIEHIEKLIDEFYRQTDIFTKKSPYLFINSFFNLNSNDAVFTKARAMKLVLKNWGLIGSANSFQKPDQAVLNRFESNKFIPPRLMSGYKFPDYTKNKINSLFSQYVLEKFFVSSSVDFSYSCLTDQVLLRPLSIKLPPALPFCFYKNFSSQTSLSDKFKSENKTEIVSETKTNLKKSKNLDINLQYRNSSLQELCLVEDVFSRLGRDFQEYLSLPKDSPLAIKMSPSLEEDELIRVEAEELRKTETAIEKLHCLQKVQQKESTFEESKQLRPFAYENKLAFCCNNVKQSSATQNPDTPEKRWFALKNGSGSVLSDRKQSFFGRKHMLAKRLVAQEEKEINDQIVKNSFSVPTTHLITASSQNVKPKDSGKSLSHNFDENQLPSKHANGDSLKELIEKEQVGLISYKKLQKAGLKRKIKLLDFPHLSAHNQIGAENRTQKAKQALHGQVIKTPYSHLRWQRKRFRSSLLGTPCNRHLTLPELTRNEWQRMLEWQIKNYFFLEEKRLDPLEKEYLGEQLKVKQLQIYLPWVSIRTASNRAFQWPLTRLDYALSAPSHQSSNDKNHLSGNKKTSLSYFCELPAYKPVYYFDSGHSVSLSAHPNSSTRLSQQIAQGKGKNRGLAFFNNKSTQSAGKEKAVRPNSPDSLTEAMYSDFKSHSYLCEPFTNQSWLFVYRLVIAFALKDVVRYVFHITYKKFANQVPGDITFSPAALVSAHMSKMKAASAQSIHNPQKRFQDVTIHEKSMLTLNEIIWHLRNSCRSRTSPRALLLVGPAKRDKTSLVQAIASEGGGLALIVQPINDLLSDEVNAYRRLERLFTVASSQAPCVVFLDSIDSVGKSRDKVMTSEKGQDDCLFALKEFTQDARMYSSSVSASLQTNLLTKAGHMETQQYANWQFNPLASNPLDQPGVEFTVGGQGWAHTIKRMERHEDLQEWSKILRFKKRRLNLLLRLLTIIDGALPLKNGILVVATSEQPAALDPALLRAGRFDRRIYLSSPSQERRIQLFKRETETLGVMQAMPWEYLSSRTTNMSLSDISSAIHYSTIRALLDNTVHTVETLEHGLNCVTGFKHKTVHIADRSKNDPFHLSRLAFYQAGKAVVHNTLLGHPELGFCSLNEATVDQTDVMSVSDITREHLKVRTTRHVPLRSVSEEMRFHSSRYQTRQALAHRSSNQKVSEGSAKLDQREQTKRASISAPPNKKGLFEIRCKRRLLLKKNLKLSISPQLFEATQSTHNFQKETQPNSLGTYQLNREFDLPKNPQVASARTRNQLEIRLIGLYAGKAAELLYLSSNVVSELESNLKNVLTAAWLWQSNLGFSELFVASSLIHLMIDRWYLYSQKIVTSKINRLIPSLNENEMEDEYLFPYVQRFCYHLQVAHIPSSFWDLPDHPTLKGSPLQKNKEKKKESDYPDLNQIYQNRINASWWNAKICHTIEGKKRPFGRWYRMYIPKTEERDDNEEWLPPDVIYHQPLRLSNLATKNYHEEEPKAYPKMCVRSFKSSNVNQRNKKRSFSFVKLSFKGAFQNTERVPAFKTLNDLYLFERDSAHQNVVMNSFYQAFSLLNERRELLDMFADHLIRFQTVRSYEMAKLCSLFSSPPLNEEL